MHWSTYRALQTIAKQGHARLDSDLLDALARDMRPRPQKWHCCPTPGCPQLVSASEPCPKHGRPRNAHWSTDRDRKAQDRFRKAVLARDGHRCTRCGSTGPLVAHHDRPGYDASAGRTLCESCHRSIDSNAR